MQPACDLANCTYHIVYLACLGCKSVGLCWDISHMNLKWERLFWDCDLFLEFQPFLILKNIQSPTIVLVELFVERLL